MPTRKADARTYPAITRAEAEAWRDLHRQLARTRTLQDAKHIAAQAAPPHAKRFYAHLRSFVRTLKSPRRGTRSEMYVYGKLRLRFAKRPSALRVTSPEQPLPRENSTEPLLVADSDGEDKANMIG
jgi:hypothetical protein